MTSFKIHLTNISKTSLKHYLSFFFVFKNNARPVLPEKTATNNRNLTELQRNAYDFKGYRLQVCPKRQISGDVASKNTHTHAQIDSQVSHSC